MLLPLLIATHFALAPVEPVSTQPPAAPVLQSESIDWFPGPLFAIKAKAEREKKGVLFVVFTDGSAWCDKLFQTTLEDPAVKQQLKNLICVKVDLTRDSDGAALDKNAERIASRFPVRSFPTILYLGTNLKPEDMISGYIPGPALVMELKRMLSGTNTLSSLRTAVAATPDDIEAIWTLAGKCYDFGYSSENQKLMARIAELDPKGISRPLRLDKLLKLQEGLFREYTRSGNYDHKQLLTFLRNEPNPSVAFTGWSQLGGLVRTFRPNLKTKKEQRAMGYLSRECYREAWEVAAPSDQLPFAVRALEDLFQDRAELKPKDRRLARQLADGIRTGVKGRNDSAAAQAIFANARAVAFSLDGKQEKAIEWIDKALKLDPSNPAYVKRKQELVSSAK